MRHAQRLQPAPVNCVYVSSPRHAFSGNSTQLRWHDSVIYTDYSFSS